VQCIFSHVRSISCDFVCSNRMLSNLRGVHFEFSHTLGRDRAIDRAIGMLDQCSALRARGVRRPDHAAGWSLGSDPDDNVPDVVELRCAGRLWAGSTRGGLCTMAETPGEVLGSHMPLSL
jgi:hypothetical protein